MVTAGSALSGATVEGIQRLRQQIVELGVRLLAPHQAIHQLERRLRVREAARSAMPMPVATSASACDSRCRSRSGLRK